MLKRALAFAAIGVGAVGMAVPAGAQTYVQDDVFTRDTTGVQPTVVQRGPVGQALPRTGDDSTAPLGRLGAGLLVAGGVTVFVAKRRQQANA
jgi:LPXTG-motif cell wall-anchored protein